MSEKNEEEGLSIIPIVSIFLAGLLMFILPIIFRPSREIIHNTVASISDRDSNPALFLNSDVVVIDPRGTFSQLAHLTGRTYVVLRVSEPISRMYSRVHSSTLATVQTEIFCDILVEEENRKRPNRITFRFYVYGDSYNQKVLINAYPGDILRVENFGRITLQTPK